MNTFFQDEYINKMILTRLTREIKKEQLERTIKEINYLNELQKHVLEEYGIAQQQKNELKNHIRNNGKNI